jgi:EAL domain-containing protein (putative c-di-GMP-specific phosphodiesterase class I)
VIAEGVELEEERATLITLGVTAAQGYLFGRPAPCSCATPPMDGQPAVAATA